MLRFLILLLSTAQGSAEVGVFDGIAKSAVGMAKDFVERVLVQIKIPRLVKLPDSDGLSFQFDSSDLSSAPVTSLPCHDCVPAIPETVEGTWRVALWSYDFHITVIADLDTHIDRLAADQDLPDQKTIFDFLADPPRPECPQLTVLTTNMSTTFEFAYTIGPNHLAKGVVGALTWLPDGTIRWQLTPKLGVTLCVLLATQDTIVFRQVDSFPACNNVLVLLRGNVSSSRIESVRAELEAVRPASFGSNSLLRTLPCE